jgi:hypothetical protein
MERAHAADTYSAFAGQMVRFAHRDKYRVVRAEEMG